MESDEYAPQLEILRHRILDHIVCREAQIRKKFLVRPEVGREGDLSQRALLTVMIVLLVPLIYVQK